MRYISTRGEAPALNFVDCLLAGLASDGGLYLPESWPELHASTIAGLAGRPYAEAAETVIAPYVADAIPRDELSAMIVDAYKNFRHEAVTPLVQLSDNLFLLELFHGPTLAFKDVAMQLLGRLMNHALKKQGKRATVVGATSGDTGAAAIEAFRELDQVDVFILYPHGRVSEVQRRQMTTVADSNIHAIALEGTFDDAQAILKSLFRDARFKQDTGLTGVNSINWARVVAQIVYYFTSAVALGAPHRPVSFAVPTGNFGDILAGYAAKKMGLPVERLVIATNENDILARTLATGRYEVKGVKATQSPSMDIQVSSNFERLLFDACGRDAATVRSLMARLDQSRAFDIGPDALAKIRADFDAASVSETETVAEIAGVYRKSGYVLDPHSAVGVAAGFRALKKHAHTPVIVAGTAHPAKFPDAIMAATGVHPPLPPHLADILDCAERFEVVANDIGAVERFIRARARATSGA